MRLVLLLSCALLASCASTEVPWGGRLPEHWIDGTEEAEPEFQVHEYAQGTWILRQSLLTNFEGPFLYLFVGDERALLLDSGAGGVDVVGAVDQLLGADGPPLLVAHTHGHGDHTAGDAELARRPNTVVIGSSAEEVHAFFRFEGRGRDLATLDLGDRVLDVFPIPGHDPAHIAVYDRKTGVLVTGDSLYPGRLYVPVDKWEAYVRSMNRVAEWCETHPVAAVLGTHIEMTDEPGVDYEFGATVHANERGLLLTPAHVRELAATLEEMSAADALERTVRDDFIVFPLGPWRGESEEDEGEEEVVEEEVAEEEPAPAAQEEAGEAP